MNPTQVNMPNFFILGAAKSGTTSLHYILNQHPEIFMTKVKEPTFFCKEFQIVNNPIKYFELYDEASDEKIRGEASHAYFSSPSSAKVLNTLFPEAKFVVILRNPADRAYSLYHHMRRHGFEYINTFEAALEAEEKRYVSKEFKAKCPQYFYNFLYFRSGLYGKQLQNYLALFSRQQFHIIRFEDFLADPEGRTREIFRFLQVDPDYAAEIEVKNVGDVTARFPRIQYHIRTKIRQGRVQKVLLNALSNLNMVRIPPMRSETRAALLERYSSDLRRLYNISGISLVDTNSPS